MTLNIAWRIVAWWFKAYIYSSFSTSWLRLVHKSSVMTWACWSSRTPTTAQMRLVPLLSCLMLLLQLWCQLVISNKAVTESNLLEAPEDFPAELLILTLLPFSAGAVLDSCSSCGHPCLVGCSTCNYSPLEKSLVRWAPTFGSWNLSSIAAAIRRLSSSSSSSHPH